MTTLASPVLEPATPWEAPAPVLLERPSIDCQPYLKGPYGYLQIQPIVYLDRARTLQGSRPVRATLVGPSASRVVTDAFTAAPGAAPRRLDLSGHGHYEFRLEADGADLDPNCTWGYDHDQYN